MAKSAASPSSGPPLELVALGGLGQFGGNMMAIRLGDSVIVVDAGVLFPTHETPGVGLILPDTSYLEEHRERLHGIVLTHGHEDHIGALPFLLRRFPTTVFGTRLTLGIVRNRLEEHALLDSAELVAIAPGSSFDVGAFHIESIHVSHSLADSVALAIETPFGKLLHTGDFKIDEGPPVGPPIDLARFGEIGKEDVLCLLSDSTNSEVPGRTPSEASVTEAFDSILAESPGRVLLTCFTSSTHRIQVAVDRAVAHGRKVALVGRSMVENVRIAIDLGYLRVPAGVLYSVEELEQVPRAKQLIVTAGSQGEPMSALSQIAQGANRFVSVEPGDRVVLSARVIPGNERAVNNVVNELFRRGADVVQPPQAHVHVSGHGSAEDLAMLTKLIKPRHFVPIHGEWRQLYHHAKIARENGVGGDAVLLAEDGDVLHFDEDGGRIVERLELTKTFLDGSGLGLVDECVVRDRRRLAGGGVIVPMVTLSEQRVLEVSDILSRGFTDTEAGEELLSEAHDVMLSAIEELAPTKETREDEVAERVEAALKRFFRKKSIRRPVIVPVVVVSEGS